MPIFADKRVRDREEELMHLALVEHLRWRADKRVIWFHVANELVRSEGQAKKFAAMGGRGGVLDFTFNIPRRLELADLELDVVVPAYLELKAEGGILSKAQLQFMSDCDALGIENAVAYSIDQALAIVTAWGVIPEETQP
jgi:hypothetical protein